MVRIKVLDEATANLIAAGEVVERPAAVVKELVENALDAGAKQVRISISGSGLASISVADDGLGMSPQEARLAILRHATSKIDSAADLVSIRTLGFRGEALPSIASVSRMRITTRRAEDLAGTELVLHAGKIVSDSVTGCPHGTEIRVEELFYNTPARLKFLKSETAESAKITEIVQRLALAWPEVSFSYRVNGREQLVTAGNGEYGDVLAAVLGRALSRQFLPLSWQGTLVSLHGFLSRPALARANRNLQYFYINRRPVRSPLLSDALLTGYLTLLPRNRFPAAVIFLETDPAEVDVNVHPAKQEVRFSHAQEIYRQFLSGVRQALRQAESAEHSRLTQTRDPVYRQDAGSPPSALSPPASVYERPRQETIYRLWETASVEKSAETPGDLTFPCSHENIFAGLIPIGQLAATYLLAQSAAGDLYLVDQHAAHERVLYNSFAGEIQEGRLAVQEVVPQTFELDPRSAAALSSALKIFAGVGLSFDPFGHNTFILRTVPLFLSHSLTGEDIMALVQAASENSEATELLGEVLKVMACKAAIKAGQPLSREEMAGLINVLAKTSQPFTCPHGRPTVITLSAAELDSRFRRR
jgi:DNA mismatch repair protein MutL